MDSDRLGGFYRTVQEWPKKEMDLGFLAEKIRKLLDCPVVHISVPGLGSRLAGFTGSSDMRPETFGVVLQRQVRQITGGESSSKRNQLRQLRLAKEANLLEDGSRLDHAAVVPIHRDTASEKRENGWIFALSNKPLSPVAEIYMVAVSAHLSSLAVIAEHESAVAMRDQFLSIASHELKTPLTSIYGILQLQERMTRPKNGAPQAPEQQRMNDFFKIVIRQVQRLNELIDNLLDVSRIHNGRFMVEPSDTEVSAIVRETVHSRLSVIAKEAGVEIQVDVPEQLSAFVDPVRFEEVVTNLGMNAIRFSPEGGMVWIRMKQEDDNLMFSVRDQGPAVPEADRNRIFQPFERAQRTSRLGGLGLGLFISRQIAQLHGGSVKLIESVAGKGNLIEARFPFRKQRRLPASA